MKRPGIDGSFFICFLLNLVLNVLWLIPVAVYFVLAAIFGWPGWIGWTLFGVWAVVILLATIFMAWAIGKGTASPNPTGLPGKATVRRSSQRPNSLEEYAYAHQHAASRN